MVVDIIKKAIFDLAKTFQEDRSDTIHVYDLTTCIRRSYYTKKLGFVMDESMAFWLLFGAVVHEMLTPVLADALGGKREVRTKYRYEDVTIYGTADVLAPDLVVELKTCNRLPYKPYRSHVEQVNSYLHFFDRPKGLIVYISRMQLGIRTFELEKDGSLFFETLEKARTLKRALDSNTPPPTNIPLSERKFYCSRCPYSTQCVGDSVLNGGVD